MKIGFLLNFYLLLAGREGKPCFPIDSFNRTLDTFLPIYDPGSPIHSGQNIDQILSGILGRSENSAKMSLMHSNMFLVLLIIVKSPTFCAENRPTTSLLHVYELLYEIVPVTTALNQPDVAQRAVRM